MKPATETPARTVPAAAPAVAVADPGSYADWPAIFAGAVVAAGIASVFATFGAAVGMASIEPYEGDGMAAAAIVAVASWMLWTTVSSVMAGSYVAGRMRRRIEPASPDERGIRDGIHGLAVWGVAVLLGAWLLGSVTDTVETAVAQTAAQPAATAMIGADADEAQQAQAVPATDRATAQRMERTAQNYAILSAFVSAASMVIAAAGGYWAAGVGGRHRDDSRTFARFGVWM